LELDYTSPVVITSDPTLIDSDPAVVRLRGIDSDSFQIKLQEPNYKVGRDRRHSAETISYIVIEEGTWEITDGTILEAGILNTDKLSSTGSETIGLDDNFGSETSVSVLTQTQTFNGRDWVTTRTDNITGNSFQVMMQEEETLNGGNHKSESIGWLAIEQGISTDGDTIIESGTTADAFTDQINSHTFGADFLSAPILLTKLASFDEPDTANSRIQSISADGFTAMVQEEQSLDDEIFHTTESLSYLALSGTSGTLVTSTNNSDNGSAEFSIAGDPRIGSILEINLIDSDPDGDGNFSYSWLSSIDNSNWSSISNNESLLVSQDLEGNQIRGLVSYTDGAGFSEAVYTDSVTVSYQNDGNAQFNISGLPQSGQTLTVELISNDPDGNGTFNYSWRSSIDAESWTEIMTGESIDVSNELEGYIIQNRITYIDQQGFSETTFTNSVTIAISSDDDFGDDINTTGRLAMGGTTLGELEDAGDRDWFQVSLTEGNTYIFDQIGDSLSDPYLYLRNEGGFILTSDDDGGSGLNSQITFTAENSGPYYLDAGAYGNAIGTYSISGQQVPATSAGFSSRDGWGEISASRAFEQLLNINLPSVEDLGGNYWGLDNLNVPEVWASSPGFSGVTGVGTTIAVIDTGVDLDHPEFIGRIVDGYDFVDNDTNADDGNGHGTHVAGTIAANNDDGYGISGVAPDALIMPIRVLDDDGYGYTSDIIEGLLWATNNDADVANLSLGGSGYSQAMADAVEYATNNQTVVVMAAGNSGGSSPDYPAAHALNYGIAVGAVDQYRNMASFSNRAGNTVMDYVTAPGEYIYSSVPGGYDIFSGTSMATPHVAGVAALLKSYDNTLTAEAIENLLIETAGNAVQTSASEVSTVGSIVNNTISLENIIHFNNNDFPDKLIGRLKEDESEESELLSQWLDNTQQNQTSPVIDFIGSNDSEFVSIDLSEFNNPTKKTNYMQALLSSGQFEYFEIDSLVTAPEVADHRKVGDPINDPIKIKIPEIADTTSQEIANMRASDLLTKQDKDFTTRNSTKKNIYEINNNQIAEFTPSILQKNPATTNVLTESKPADNFLSDDRFPSPQSDYLTMQVETFQSLI